MQGEPFHGRFFSCAIILLFEFRFRPKAFHVHPSLIQFARLLTPNGLFFSQLQTLIKLDRLPCGGGSAVCLQIRI